MIKILFDLLCIAIIIVVITDISDWPSTVKKSISYILTKGKLTKTEYRLHLIDCSFCQIWWSGLIYLIIIGQFTFPYVAIVCLLCTFCGLIKSSILLVEDIITKIINLIYKYFIDR
jgi:hypothetical protein